MRTIRCLLLPALLLIAVSGCVAPRNNRDILFQTSTISALLEGVYDGHLTCKELKKHGDTGIGTFDALDGEMVMLDGNVYQMKADGAAYPADDSLTTPFAVATLFEPDHALTVSEVKDYEDLKKQLDAMLPTKNALYALRIEGTFSYIRTRSVPRQTKPYPRLIEVARSQPTFEYRDVKGTLIGFRLSDYMEGVNVRGYHLHFIDSERMYGGHLLECQADSIEVHLDRMSQFHMTLPEGGDFDTFTIKAAEPEEVGKIER